MSHSIQPESIQHVVHRYIIYIYYKTKDRQSYDYDIQWEIVLLMYTQIYWNVKIKKNIKLMNRYQ